MKTVFTTQEGVKMNADLDLGGTESFLHELNYFVVLSDSFWGVELKFYYRLTDDGYIQLAYALLKDSPELTAQFKLRYKTLKENLTFMLRAYFEANLPYQDKLDFEHSPLLTQEEYDAIIENIYSEKKAISDKAKKAKTPLITYLEEQELHPRPTGTDAHSWVAACPSGKNHSLGFLTPSDEWGCGYYKRKGKLPELKTWLTKLGIT